METKKNILVSIKNYIFAYLMPIMSLFTFIYSPFVKLYRNYKNHTTGEVFVSNKVMSILENSSNEDKETLLKKLYDI